MLRLIRKLRKDENGATAIEYGLIAAVFSIVILLALLGIGPSLQTLFGMVSAAMAVVAGAG